MTNSSRVIFQGQEELVYCFSHTPCHEIISEDGRKPGMHQSPQAKVSAIFCQNYYKDIESMSVGSAHRKQYLTWWVTKTCCCYLKRTVGKKQGKQCELVARPISCYNKDPIYIHILFIIRLITSPKNYSLTLIVSLSTIKWKEKIPRVNDLNKPTVKEINSD